MFQLHSHQQVFFQETERLAVALLMSQTGFGEIAFWRLYDFLRQHQISFDEFVHTKDKTIFPLSKNNLESIKNIKNEYKNCNYFEWLAQHHISVYLCTDANYPPLLKVIDLPPPLIYSKGKPIQTVRSLAVIGSRQMTSYGELVIASWLPKIIDANVPIISGAVRGVDRTTQQLALDYGGQTIAVLGHGLAGAVGTEQQRLLTNWEAAGAWLVSCFAPKVNPSKGTFLARNRVVAGMSLAVLVIEAGRQSGTMHTATWTAEFGRQLLAVPGSVFNQFSDGTAALVNQGAQLVVSPEEVLSVLNATLPPNINTTGSNENSVRLGISNTVWSISEKAVWNIVRAGEIQIHTLIAQLISQFTLSNIQQALRNLEERQVVVQKNGWVLADKLDHK